MNPRFHAAIGEAMSRLRTADVTGATAAVQRALAGREPMRRGDPDSGTQSGDGFETPSARGLRAILQKLRNERANFVPTPSHGDAIAEEARDSENFRARRFQSAVGSVAYKLYLPSDHADRELALVMMLHGCTQNPDDFARGTRMNALAEEFGLIVAYPLQPKSANAQGCWNWFDARHQERGAGEPAVLAGLAQELASEFKIDRKRVFVAGLSAGGAMADVLSSAYPDVFSAVGIHSGLPHGAACDVMSAFAAMKGNGKAAAKGRSPIRKIIFHGGADARVHPSNGKRVFDLARSAHGEPPEFQTDTVINGKRVTRSLLGHGQDPAIAEHWLIHGGGHAWSGGDHLGSYVDATGPDASREMIRFFLEA
ncbi:PHB depolymerase family esterase [Bosea sp. F3-2]|uniref:extracellular catalytic domain type 1 short-chain-length polyhydroxyalkanoate depolymerase n=1 Tax=Bosea sp. F3-2 TaxID=2599640 RepID=UPI0011EE0E89|nr:PHB depolymerase family esterase [Bosea sp. F3-2]QEL26225.1 PHB depolymerase family esterase [Bosea sp. F3-2]